MLVFQIAANGCLGGRISQPWLHIDDFAGGFSLAQVCSNLTLPILPLLYFVAIRHSFSIGL